ncbi:uncharacterized protein T551_00743 [Pneumocystis jirovecii RU7]|uniref:tRNA-splicing endonuclease subunit Sen15 domain-containing protein n=1 Tax=Pneumocystis jirovecii (strain RU7) TaxID=1408657 RepID=A0A0W4ZUJ8_PNEJ7|nr:uncharacterized protein T551_00743 [Pneumocystis jirovecii RU7]KTW32061.1 hypothetical protein T551_00743 [Pneumocystis jirovecii RU7]
MKQRLTTFPPPELKKYSFLETYTFLYSVYTDLLLSQLWEELKIHQLPSNRSIIQGISPQNHKTFYVYPCSLEESISIKKICELYNEVWNILGEDKQTLLLGIVSPDSTIVYYKINNGLIKPRKNDED